MYPEWIEAAVVDWTGWKKTAWPHRFDQAVLDRFGADGAAMLALVQRLKDEFYETNAWTVEGDLAAMSKKAVADFSARHPELPGTVALAFGWCYTYDYK